MSAGLLGWGGNGRIVEVVSVGYEAYVGRGECDCKPGRELDCRYAAVGLIVQFWSIIPSYC